MGLNSDKTSEVFCINITDNDQQGLEFYELEK